jgi:hypothetical protein
LALISDKLPCRYFKIVWDIHPDTIWLDLCLDPNEAKDYSRVFLRHYVENSKRKVLVLGPKESEERRALNSAASVLNCWRALIAKADSTVLLIKRREDPKNRYQWRLKFIDHSKQRGQGPIFEVSKVSQA